MNRNFLKIVVLINTFVIGLTLVWAFSPIPISIIEFSNFQKKSIYKKQFPNKDVVVLFKGFFVENKETMAEFEIINLSDKAIKYSSYEDKGSLLYHIKFNNKELENRWCGTGLQEFELAPNDSINMKFIAEFLFQDKFSKKGEFQLGFYLGVNDREYQQFWTDTFTIPKTIKDQIKQEKNNRQNQREQEQKNRI
jgi:hypothetical protein